MAEDRQIEEDFERAVYLCWEESERGWGTRPDGFSLHLSEDQLRSFVKSYWDGMPKEVPDEYSRPVGRPTEIRVSISLYNKIKKSELGMRLYDEDSLIKSRDLIFVGKRTGWVPLEDTIRN